MRFPVDEEVFEEEQRLDVRSCDERLAAVVVVRGGKRRGMEDTVWWRKKNRSRVAFSSMFSLQGGCYFLSCNRVTGSLSHIINSKVMYCRAIQKLL